MLGGFPTVRLKPEKQTPDFLSSREAEKGAESRPDGIHTATGGSRPPKDGSGPAGLGPHSGCACREGTLYEASTQSQQL